MGAQSVGSRAPASIWISSQRVLLSREHTRGTSKLTPPPRARVHSRVLKRVARRAQQRVLLAEQLRGGEADDGPLVRVERERLARQRLVVAVGMEVA